jgi:glutaryl-CoA dehydrogenase
MPTVTKDVKAHKPLPAPNTDFYYLYETLPAEELAIVKRVREFMETKVEPVITDYWVKDEFPFELLPAVKELGIGGVAMKGYGCAGGSLALLGFIQMEIACIDPSFSTFLGVQQGRLLRSNRTVGRFRCVRWTNDYRQARSRYLDTQRREALDRQCSLVRCFYHLGTRRC